MKPRARRALPLVLLIAAAAAVAQTPVGELVDVTGRVDIDAFATLEFLSARERERVYQQSAVRLADGAVAWLLIDSQRIPLTAGVNRVSDHLAAREKRQRKPLFRALAEILFGTGKGSETQVALGTRASEASSDDGFGFFDDGQTLDSAEKHLGGGEYEEALAELQALLDPDLAAPGHVDYLYGSAYFGLGNFDAAYQRLGRALDDVEANSIEVPHFLPALLMRLGYTAYLVDDAPLARDAADLLSQHQDSAERGHALLLLVQLDIDAGLMTSACSRVDTGSTDPELASLAAELQALGTAAGC